MIVEHIQKGFMKIWEMVYYSTLMFYSVAFKEKYWSGKIIFGWHELYKFFEQIKTCSKNTVFRNFEKK